MAPLKVAVVGGGIAGLSAAWTLRRHAVASGRPVEVRLYEASPRLGGKIATERRDGFLLEAGPDSFVTRKPQAVELARELGLGDRLIPTDPRHDCVWMVRHGRLTEIPPSMGHVLPCRLAPIWSSQLLSWRGKLRLAMDLVLPRRRAAGDESLGSFLRRRFGQEVVDRLAGPLLAGIYVADPDQLSLAATFPHFAHIERRHGSVIRGLRAQLSAHGAGDSHSASAESGRSGARSAGGPGAHSATARAHGSVPEPSTRMALQGGIGELVDALVAALGEPVESADLRLLTSTAVCRLEPPGQAGGSWRVRTEQISEGKPGPGSARANGAPGSTAAPVTALGGGGTREGKAIDGDGIRRALAGAKDRATEAWDCDAVVLALPAFAAADLLRPFAAEAAGTLDAIPYVSTATVSLGYRVADLPRPLDGYGFIVPAAERRHITACTWSSAKFPGRAGEDHALLRVFLGGAGSGGNAGEAHLEADDATLVRHAREDLADLMALDADPILTQVHRHHRATPQYTVGHPDRVAHAESTLPPGLHLAGSAFHGIGVPDCISSGDSAALRSQENVL